MDATSTALAEIVQSVQPGPLSDWVDGAQLVAALASLVAVSIAVVALRGERSSRSNSALLVLVEYFDAKGYFLRMWRLDQATRTDGPESIGCVPVRSLTRHEKPVVANLANEAFASDWIKTRADMYGVYFFALRVYAWLGASPRYLRDRKARQLNDTFGHQLLGTFLNHSMVACRVRNERVGDDYYPTHYGLFDRRYSDLIERLASDLFTDERLEAAVRSPMERKRDSLNAYLEDLRPSESAADLVEDEHA